MKPAARRALAAALLCCALAALAPAQQPQPTPPSAPTQAPPPEAARRVEEFVRLVNTGDRKAARLYVEQNFTPASLQRVPVEQRLGTISRLRDVTRGMELQGAVRQPKPQEATALVRNKLTGEWEELLFIFEPDAPYRIERFGLRAAGPPDGAAAPAARLTEQEAARELEAFLRKLSEADVFSGSVLLAKDGKVIFAGAYGEANKDFRAPNRLDTKFNLGSMNKMFTAVAVAQLAEQGKLSFEDPLSKFVPDFPGPEAAQKIKLKHLLTHTSGLGSFFNETFDQTSRARLRTIDDFMGLAKGETLQFEPGARWDYSNTGFLVLGKVVEKASGQDYFDYVREHVYKRAGMTGTDAYELDRVNPNLAVGYQKEYTDAGTAFRNNVFEHVIRGGPAGGGYSTAEDMLRFDRALRAGRLVGPEYVKLLLSPKPELNSPRYGYGFELDAGEGVAGHSGGFPGISSDLHMYLKSGHTGVVLSNYGGAAGLVVNKMRALVRAMAQ